MKNFKLKAKYKEKQVGFNGSAAPLGDRKDLDILYKMAVDSKSESLLELFEITEAKTVSTVKSKKVIDKKE